MFYEKAVNNFLNRTENNLRRKESEQFLNNAEQKIILCRILEIVYVENSEQFSRENSEQFYLVENSFT